MPKTRRRLLAALGIAVTFAFGGNVAAQTFSLAPGSPTAPLPGAVCGPPFSPDGDILGLGAVSIVPMGPPLCGLGWFGPPPPMPANVDGFSTGLFAIPAPPIPVGIATFLFGVDPLATGDAGGCTPFAPGFTPPDVGTEAAALTDAPADVFAACWGAPGCPPPLPAVPMFAPYSMSNFQVFDGNGIPIPPYAPAPGIGLLGEPAAPGLGDDLDAFDGAAIGLWVVPPGVPAVPVYFSVDAPTAGVAGVLPSDVFVTVGGIVAGVYAPAFAFGLDLIGGPGSDDLDALEIFDADGMPMLFAPAGGDVALFSVAPGSAIIGAPNPCPGPLLGYPIGPGDILTEGTSMGAPGLACVLVPSTNMGLWNGTAFGCLPNPFGAVDDNLNALALSLPLSPPPPPPTATATATPTPTPTETPTVATTATATPPPLPTCGAAPVAGCRTPAAPLKALFILKDKSPDDKDLIIWKWIKGSVTSKADYGTPLTTTHYQLCVYNGSPSLILDATMPAGGMCDIANPKPCWQDKPTGFKYKDKDATPDGITKMVLKEGLAAGKAKIILKGKGSLLDDPTPGGPAFATSPITVQLRNGTNCWEAVYSSPYIKNVTGPPGQFKDKAD